MDFVERLNLLASRAQDRIHLIVNEEGSKHALVLPFLTELGYDISDPSQVVPEFTADVGIRKGEKADYAICRDGSPIILVECKSAKSSLTSEDTSQLFRYFTTTDARFGILTNGISYRFYTDLEAPNKMDGRPFLKFDLFDFAARDVENLRPFVKDSFSLRYALRAASDIKYTTDIKRFLSNQTNKPDEDFVSYVRDRVCSTSATKPDQGQFMRILRECLRDLRRGSRPGVTTKPLTTPVVTPPVPSVRGTKNPTTIMGHAIAVLNEAGLPLGATELARRILKRGYASRSKDPIDTMRSTIWDETKRPSPRIVKDGKNYGLPEWYQRSGVVVPISSK